MDPERRLIADGAIAIRGNRILAVGPDREIAARHVAAREIDAGGAPVHPGFIECHKHASFQLYRGALPDHLAESDAFDSVEAHFYNNVTDEEEYLSVLLSAIEMVRNGTTCILEAGTILTPDAAARAAEFVGIRAVLADPFIWDQPQGFAQGQGRGTAGLRRLRLPWPGEAGAEARAEDQGRSLGPPRPGTPAQRDT